MSGGQRVQTILCSSNWVPEWVQDLLGLLNRLPHVGTIQALLDFLGRVAWSFVRGNFLAIEESSPQVPGRCCPQAGVFGFRTTCRTSGLVRQQVLLLLVNSSRLWIMRQANPSRREALLVLGA